MVALIGSSGSGKSTLLRLICGFEEADKDSKSEILLFEQSLQKNGKLSKKIQKSRAKIGFIFQQFNLIKRLNVMTNVLIGTLSNIPFWRGNLAWFTKDDKKLAMQCLKRVKLEEFALHKAADLSGGQQQRVAIAKVLAQNAELILADEPIASLDPESSHQVLKSLRDIQKKDGKTLLVTLHQVDFAMHYCERIIALKNGEVLYDGPSKKITQEMLETIYGSESLSFGELDDADFEDEASSDEAMANPAEQMNLDKVDATEVNPPSATTETSSPSAQAADQTKI